ncbi:MAG: beta-propeller repeat protein [Acidobacteriaceae bacterium]|nr:beta-propeller repeat protein [Acidobacteriaceae bacterium]
MQFSRVVRSISLMAGAMMVVAPGVSAFAATGPYAVVDKWVIGGQGGWDYLLADPSMHVVYLTHGPRVEVVDTKTGKAVGSITDLKGTHGIALDAEGKYGYISDGGANAVVVFDRKTYAKVNSIATGTNPDGITFEPVTKTVWAFNGRSNDASVIDTATMKVAATIKLSGKPEFPQADGKGTVFVNIETKNSIVRLDAKALKVTAEWPLAGCESPSGLAMDTAGRRLFSVCDGKKMAVTSADSGKVLKLVEIGDGPDAAGYDANNQVAFSSNGDGTLTVVDAKGSDYKVIQNVETPKRARTMSFDAGTGRIYLLAAEYGPAPAATAAVPKPRPTVVPGSYSVIVVGKK